MVAARLGGVLGSLGGSLEGVISIIAASVVVTASEGAAAAKLKVSCSRGGRLTIGASVTEIADSATGTSDR